MGSDYSSFRTRPGEPTVSYPTPPDEAVLTLFDLPTPRDFGPPTPSRFVGV